MQAGLEVWADLSQVGGVAELVTLLMAPGVGPGFEDLAIDLVASPRGCPAAKGSLRPGWGPLPRFKGSPLRRRQSVPVEERVPEEPVVRTVQVPVYRVEVEGEDTAPAGREVEERGPPLQVVFPLDGAADEHFDLVLLCLLLGILRLSGPRICFVAVLCPGLSAPLENDAVPA